MELKSNIYQHKLQKNLDIFGFLWYNACVKNMAPWPSGKAKVCNTSPPQFKSGWRLQKNRTPFGVLFF